jgi:DNA-binding ferritin-like protein
MEDIVIGISLESGSLQDKTFIFLVKLMGYRNQLRMNHWQTESYAEHKATDKLTEKLTDYIDSIGETSLGALGRPKMNTMSTNISDISIANTDYVLQCLETDVKGMIQIYKETEHEGIIALLGELDAIVQQYKYLNTLS